VSVYVTARATLMDGGGPVRWHPPVGAPGQCVSRQYTSVATVDTGGVMQPGSRRRSVSCALCGPGPLSVCCKDHVNAVSRYHSCPTPEHRICHACTLADSAPAGPSTTQVAGTVVHITVHSVLHVFRTPFPVTSFCLALNTCGPACVTSCHRSPTISVILHSCPSPLCCTGAQHAAWRP
jgi:hypothetical protein